MAGNQALRAKGLHFVGEKKLFDAVEAAVSRSALWGDLLERGLSGGEVELAVRVVAAV